MSGFVDEASLSVRGGDGGAGSVSFRREAHVPRGGPDGGDGGRGGDLWLYADREVASLLAFRDRPHRRAASGSHGMGRARHGSRGEDLRVPVPEGTIVKDTDGNVLADLVSAGDTWLAARGGRGGRGNARFLSNRRRAPSFAEQGEVGEERWLRLELKLMADVALVGFPNAGKSTLISAVSAAKPKIADYPFTTLEPHLGVVVVDGFEMVWADIPGLIEGASEGKGLGHQFLRHIERARVLLVLVDLAAVDETPPAEQERILVRELGRYRPELLERPRLVVGTKADVGLLAAGDDPGLRTSAVTGQGLTEVLRAAAALVAETRAAQPMPETYVVHRPEPEGVQVTRADDGAYVVLGRPAERAVAVNDLTNPQALEYVRHRLSRLGVDRALARAGARPGDLVRVGGFTFEYVDQEIEVQGRRPRR
ncbi:MAG TPA: GTPase ObgE [Acidimicrobiales bacterium]|jgi:GTP-binding protein|nr:GTPase ObgE [Acidimicrobiales bacterium]